MELKKYKCVICYTEEELPDIIELYFPELDVICPKCKKAMKGGPAMVAQEIKVEQKKQSRHPEDPRPDIKEDAELWLELLKRLYVCNKELYATFHGLRCAASKLELKDGKINFIFSDEFDNVFIEKTRKEYIMPHIKIIQGVMSRLAKDITSNKALEDCPV